MSLLEIKELTHGYGENLLYKNAHLQLNKGEHLGIVGQNGTGKSTLIKICMDQIIPDQGNIVWQPRITIGCLDQNAFIDGRMTMREFLESAFSNLYEMEKSLNQCYERLAQGEEGVLHIAAQYQETLEKNDFYTVDTRISKVVSGLGLSVIGLERHIAQMSGGQRAKVILAKLLLEEPDVLLLDEPTNFLDKEHIEWLEEYLLNFQNAFMVVSHDYDFLNKVANKIADIDDKKITKYSGTYKCFLEKKHQLREDYVRQYSAQQKEIKKTKEFIEKNIAGRKSKMARGRQKQLERMDKMEALQEKEMKPHFQFQELPSTNTIKLLVRQLSVGYEDPVLSNLNFSVKGGEKVVITGFNGIGKTTLLKTLVGQLPALYGTFSFSEQTVIGYFKQDLTWEDENRTPIEIVSEEYPVLSNKEVRKNLARCGVSSEHGMQAVGSLSGGEQTKVKICILSLKPCNFLILDEPTNHLDIQAKKALKEALYNFKGTVVLVSHEEEFYKELTRVCLNVH